MLPENQLHAEWPKQAAPLKVMISWAFERRGGRRSLGEDDLDG